MIKINVYDNPVHAKRVYESYFQLLISIRFPFPVGAIEEALNQMFIEEYGQCGVGLDLNGRDSFNKNMITEKYVNAMVDFNLAIKGDNISSVKKRGKEELISNHYYLANRIIHEASQTLYNYLYCDKTIGHVYGYSISTNRMIYIKTDNLGKLLCGYMDELKCFEEYKKSKKEIEDNEEKFHKPYKEYLEEIVFCFKKVDKKEKEVYRFAQSLGVKVCPYCNRNYIQVIEKRKEDTFHTRPELDHFRNKSDFPFLALSMRNLVPSCRVCNGIKGNKDNVILYPYNEEVGDAFKFSISTRKNISYFTGHNCEYSYNLSIKKDNSIQIDKALDEKIKNSMSLFGWNTLYDEDKKYALKVFQNAYIYNKHFEECYVKLLKKATSYSEEELRHILNPKLVDKKEFSEEPLAKMTYDIVHQADDLEKTDQKTINKMTGRLDDYIIRNVLSNDETDT